MQRFKMFSSASCGDDLQQLERLVSEWLSTEQPRVHHVAQSAYGPHLVVSFLCTGHADEDAGGEAAAVPDVFDRIVEQAETEDAEPAPLPEVDLPY
jgi:hypothetical protein